MGFMMGSDASGHLHSWGVGAASVLGCSWLCRAQRVKQRIPEDALSYSRD